MSRVKPLRLLVWAALCLLVGADAIAAASSPMGSSLAGWQAVLVAGDNEQPVFDNAVVSIRNWLTAGGVPAQNIQALSATPQGGVLGTAEPASAERVLARIAALRPGRGGGCL